MGLVTQQAWWPDIEWLLKLRFKDESKNDGGICSSEMYMIHLYCLGVQASIYSDMVRVLACQADGPGLIPGCSIGD